MASQESDGTGGNTAGTGGGGGASSVPYAPSSLLSRISSRNVSFSTNFSMEVFDHEVVPSSLVSIVPILRVASEIEHERPRVAYLCK